MKDILFKAKSTRDYSWKYGYLSWFGNIEGNRKFFINNDEVMTSTICQYVGVKDIEGKRIFDNDIVELSDCSRYVVQWCNYDCAYFLSNDEVDENETQPKLSFDLIQERKLKVVDNLLNFNTTIEE